MTVGARNLGGWDPSLVRGTGGTLNERRSIDRFGLALALGACVSCTASVGDDPFASVGMSGATMGDTESPPVGSDTGGSTVADPDGPSTGDPMGSSDGDDSTGEDPTTGADCNPPCDPMTAVCEAGECVAPGAPAPGELVISEFMPNPDLVTDDNGEWLELTNVSAGPVNIEGCILYDASSDEDVIDSGVPIVVPPGGTVVLAKVVDMALNGGIAGVPYGFGTSYSLVNTGDEIRLECAGAVVDQVVYLDTWAFDAGVAAQLDAASLDATANDASGSWCAATAAYGVGDLGTPGQANAGC